MRPVAATLALILALAACRGSDPAPESRGYGFVDSDALFAECLAGDGVWARDGSAGRTCIHDTADAGRSCSAADDCEGFCLARSRSCAPVRPLMGCHEILTANGARATQCTE